MVSEMLILPEKLPEFFFFGVDLSIVGDVTECHTFLESFDPLFSLSIPQEIFSLDESCCYCINLLLCRMPANRQTNGAQVEGPSIIPNDFKFRTTDLVSVLCQTATSVNYVRTLPLSVKFIIPVRQVHYFHQ
jgi:hypothetical protein